MITELISEIIVANGPPPRAGSFPNLLRIKVIINSAKEENRSAITIEIAMTNAINGCFQNNATIPNIIIPIINEIDNAINICLKK